MYIKYICFYIQYISPLPSEYGIWWSTLYINSIYSREILKYECNLMWDAAVMFNAYSMFLYIYIIRVVLNYTVCMETFCFWSSQAVIERPLSLQLFCHRTFFCKIAKYNLLYARFVWMKSCTFCFRHILQILISIVRKSYMLEVRIFKYFFRIQF